MNQEISTCIWCNHTAHAMAQLYTTAFPHASVVQDSGITINMLIGDTHLLLLNGGPHFSPNASLSLFTIIKGEEELQKAWQALTDGGRIMMPLDKYPWSLQYGWVEDKYGVSWQLSLPMEDALPKTITPCLMFSGPNAGKAAEAIDFYLSVIKPSHIKLIDHYSETDADVKGYIKHAQLMLGETCLIAMDSSNEQGATFSEGMSLILHCHTQEEIDGYWEKLAAGGSHAMCGWLKDKFGVSWQIVPTALSKLLQNSASAHKVMQALMQMKKLVIADLEAAANSQPS